MTTSYVPHTQILYTGWVVSNPIVTIFSLTDIMPIADDAVLDKNAATVESIYDVREISIRNSHYELIKPLITTTNKNNVHSTQEHADMLTFYTLLYSYCCKFQIVMNNPSNSNDGTFIVRYEILISFSIRYRRDNYCTIGSKTFMRNRVRRTETPARSVPTLLRQNRIV